MQLRLYHIFLFFFSGMDNFGRAQASFLATLTKNMGDENSQSMFCSKAHGAKKGEEEFCEAVKVDVSKTKETYFQASITNTIALVSVLFEDFGVAVELLEKAKIINILKRHSQVGIRYYSTKLFNLSRDS